MGFTELAQAGLANQDTDASPEDEEAAVADVAPAAAPDASTEQTKAPQTLAFAYPDPRPGALNENVATPVAAPAEPQPQPEAVDANQVSEPQQAAEATAPELTPAKKRGFFASLFGSRSEQPKSGSVDSSDAEPKAVEKTELRLASNPSEAPSMPQVKLSSFDYEPSAPVEKKIIIGSSSVASAYMANALPGVRANSELFDLVRKSGGSDDSDVDFYEEEGSYQVAAATGLARLAPHGLLKQRGDVDTSCFKPRLVHMLKAIERHYGKRVIVTSGYRNPEHNRRVRGARKSAHMDCAAADIQVAGVSRWELAQFARKLPGRGGVGTYCHTASVHVDVGAERDWNWRCPR